MAIFGVINTADGGDTFYEGMVKAKDNFATLETEITDARDGKASTHAAIAEKVTGPSTNTANYVPQWNGTNSKTLKNGFAIASGSFSETEDTQYQVTKNIGTVTVGDLILVEGHYLVDGWDTPGEVLYLEIGYVAGEGAAIVTFISPNVYSVRQYASADASGDCEIHITALATVTGAGTLTLRATGPYDASYTEKILDIGGIFLKKQ